MGKKMKWMFFCVFVFGLLVFTQEPAFAVKPPWSGGPGGPGDYPPEAPEPIALTLIGMGLSGAAGYYLGRRKSRKSRHDFVSKEEFRACNLEDKSPKESL